MASGYRARHRDDSLVFYESDKMLITIQGNVFDSKDGTNFSIESTETGFKVTQRKDGKVTKVVIG